MRGFPLAPCITREQRRAVEDAVTAAFGSLAGDYTGSYSKLNEILATQLTELAEKQLYFDKPGLRSRGFVAGLGRDWPDSRGIYTNRTRDIAVWVNEEDHIKVISVQKGGDIAAAFKRFSSGIFAIEGALNKDDIEFQLSEHYGYLTVCPSKVGAGITVTVTVLLPWLGCQGQHLDTICNAIGLSVEKVEVLTDKKKKSELDDCTWKVWNICNIGLTENRRAQWVVQGVAELIELEKKMDSGADITQCLPEGTLHPSFPFMNRSYVSQTARVLSEHPEIYHQLMDVRTSNNFNFNNVIQLAFDLPKHPIGCVAFDEECYTEMRPFFDAMLLRAQGFGPTATARHDLGPQYITGGENTDSRFLISTRLMATRNISGIPLLSGCSRADRRRVEDIAKRAFHALPDNIKGEYYSLGAMTDDELFSLWAYGLAFKKPAVDSFLNLSGCARDWPDARGVYVTAGKSVAIFVNEEEHLKVVSFDKGGNMISAFSHLAQVLTAVDKALTDQGEHFMYDDRYGFLSACPSKVGCGLNATAGLCLVAITVECEDMSDICGRLGLQAEPWHPAYVSDPIGHWEISVIPRADMSEAECVQTLIKGVQKLITVEKWLKDQDPNAFGSLISNIPDKFTPITIKTAEDRYCLFCMRFSNSSTYIHYLNGPDGCCIYNI